MNWLYWSKKQFNQFTYYVVGELVELLLDNHQKVALEMLNKILAKQPSSKNAPHFNLLAEAEKDGFQSKRRSSSKGGQYNGACVLGCDGLGDDRLRIQPDNGPYGWFICEHCNSKGSGVDWVMIKRGMSKIEALQYVGWAPKDGSEFHIPAQSFKIVTHEAPSQAWQTSGRAFIEYCESALWSDIGKDALSYLHGRGLKDETIKLARLGYNHHEMMRPGWKWGLSKTIWLTRGITIPWFIEGGLWRITVRDESITDGNLRYKQIAGGSNGLYLADFLYQFKPVLICEGEFDALSIAQECGRHVVAVATGSTSGSRVIRWVAELARCERVFVVFDAENGKGDSESSWWLERLPHAKRLRPWWKDANQMLQDGADLLMWIQLGLNQSGTGEMDSQTLSELNHARSYLAQLRSGILSPDRPDHFGSYDNAIYDIEHIWMDLESRSLIRQILPDSSIEHNWNSELFEEALGKYAQDHPEVQDLLNGTATTFSCFWESKSVSVPG